MCKVLNVQRSGYYAWAVNPKSNRQKESDVITGWIFHYWKISAMIYGYRKIHHDLLEHGFELSPGRTYRLMKQASIKAQVGYKKRKGLYGKPSVVAENHLNREFSINTPNQRWVTDITYSRTYEGWLFLCTIQDLFSRKIVGWSMDSQMKNNLIMKALMMAIWNRKPKNEIIIHSDQGSQYTSYEWRDFLKVNNFKMSNSRRGNCHDNATAESFFSLLKREKIRNQTYKTREAAKTEIFEFIEMFYNPVRRHGTLGMISPNQF